MSTPSRIFRVTRRFSKTLARTSGTWVVAATVGLGAPAVAAEQSPQLEEVIVTARKMLESMQDVSIAVSAFSGEQLDRLIMRDIREIEGFVPNFVIDTLAVSPASASIYIRGVGTQEVERSFDPAVGVVIDGVPLSFANGSLANTFDFQSVEVLRGPQVNWGSSMRPQQEPTICWISRAW